MPKPVMEKSPVVPGKALQLLTALTVSSHILGCLLKPIGPASPNELLQPSPTGQGHISRGETRWGEV